MPSSSQLDLSSEKQTNKQNREIVRHGLCASGIEMLRKSTKTQAIAH